MLFPSSPFGLPASLFELRQGKTQGRQKGSILGIGSRNICELYFLPSFDINTVNSRMVMTMHKITNVTVLHNYKLELEYDDGRQGIVDLSHLAGKGVFSLWNDYDVFRKVKIGSSGELVWNDQVDLCPDSLYLKLTNQKPEDLFPSL
jgi:hypothetical protein